jgi:hypothetical protein
MTLVSDKINEAARRQQQNAAEPAHEPLDA